MTQSIMTTAILLLQTLSLTWGSDMSSESDSARSTFMSTISSEEETDLRRQLSLICPVVSLIRRTWKKHLKSETLIFYEHLNLIAADQATAGDHPERGGDDERYEEVVLGAGKIKPGDNIVFVSIGYISTIT